MLTSGKLTVIGTQDIHVDRNHDTELLGVYGATFN